LARQRVREVAFQVEGITYPQTGKNTVTWMIRKKGNVGRDHGRRANRYEPDQPVSNSTLRIWGFNPSAVGTAFTTLNHLALCSIISTHTIL